MRTNSGPNSISTSTRLVDSPVPCPFVMIDVLSGDLHNLQYQRTTPLRCAEGLSVVLFNRRPYAVRFLRLFEIPARPSSASTDGEGIVTIRLSITT